MDQTTQTPRFLSLKWRALLLTSLVLVAVFASYAAYSSHEFRRIFKERRTLVHEQDTHQVQGMLERSATRLQQLGSAVAALPTVQHAQTALVPAKTGEALNRPRTLPIAKDLENIMSILDLNLGIQTAAIFFDSTTPIVAHGWPQDKTSVSELSAAVQKTMASEAPTGLYRCDGGCTQYAVVPLLGNMRSVGAVLLGTSPADLILEFQRASGSDIGLMVLNATGRSENVTTRWIEPWLAEVVALSNLEKNIELLRQFAESAPDPDAQTDSTVVQHGGRSYDVYLTKLHQFEPRERAYLIFVEDISDELQEIKAATQQSIELGIAGLVVSETLLLAILWTPMSRLRRAADTLPMLAEAAYAQVRDVISSKPGRRWPRDEVDVLDDTAIALSHQLETLNNKVGEHTRVLSDHMQALAQEKGFIANILNTAQALILTHDQSHKILMINRYGENLTGYDEGELTGKPLSILLTQDVLEPGVMRLAELASLERDHIEEERDIRCKDGSTLNIVWHHSLLDSAQQNGTTVLSIGMDITARKNAELRLAWLADHDPLTRLFNRRRFQEELKEALASSRRYGHGGALLFFDLDQFKYVNDTSGHRAGDQLLEELGLSLPQLLREVDVLGRIGGDEFAVILPHATDDEAVSVAKKILAYISNKEFHLSGRIHKVSASIGIALFPRDGDSAGDLMARADIAMYQVKDTGRGGWHLFSRDDESHRLIQERFTWKERIEKALANDGFLLYVQPIVRIPDGQLSHYEVLLRMKGEDGSAIAPAQFIDVAERSGLIHAIDRMVLSTAIRYLAMLENRGVSATFAINLSAHSLNDPELLNHLKGLLQDTGLNPHQVILEMTETAAVSDLNSAKSMLSAIQELGCRFALDDFGTGFSSFYYMRELPMEFLKIDGAFIRNLPDNPDDQALVMVMGQIARAFGKKTIAEHVENAATLRLLEEYGINYSQGYFTGKPEFVDAVFSRVQPI